MNERNALQGIAAHFVDETKISSIQPLGNGLINDTYKIMMKGLEQPRYVLQHINDKVFTDVEMLQHNIEIVTEHIRQKYKVAGITDIDRRVLHFLKSDTGKTYVKVGEEYWRVMDFITDSITQDAVTPQSAYDAGRSFGDFESLLADVKEPIGEIIPNFHNIEFRLQQLDEAIAHDPVGRMKDHEVQDYVKKIKDIAYEMSLGERLFREGKLPKRICHCDTKVNNMLFDKSGNVLCIIDLDTVMPSFIFSDYGDFLRSAANTGAEDDPDLGNIHFNREIYNAFNEGYLKGTQTFLTALERELLPFAVCLFPYMQTVRFFADYINGDTYYKVRYPEHNMVRTRAQWKLFEEVIKSLEFRDESPLYL